MNGFAGFLGRSLRGVRLVEFGALLVLLVMATGVYLAKAAAGRERADITQVQSQIDDESKRLRLLQAEVAHLEEPERLTRLSAQLGLGPTAPKHQGSADELGQIAHDALLPEKADKKAAAVVHEAAVTGAPQ
jgi:cell division protein FtsL